MSPAAVTAIGAAERGLARMALRAWWPYPAAAILSLLTVALVMQLWRADLRLPFVYRGEALYNGVLVKSLLEHGWHLGNPALGAPTGLDLRDVPMSDNNLHFALMRPLRLLTSGYGRAMNAYFLLTFPLTALSALYVFRRFGVAAWPALCGALLYAFVPFHFARGLDHLFLAAYFLVPPAAMVALWIMSGALRGRRELAESAVVCALLGSGGVYYAFFACFFFLLAGVVAAVRRRRARALGVPVALVALTSLVLVLHYVPSIVHLARHGDTPAVRRSPVDADTYGLKISQLLLPTTGHRLAVVARFKDAFNSERGVNESDGAALGVIGSVGFLALLLSLLLPGVAPPPRDVAAARTWRDLGLLNLGAVLLGTIGGFGALVALLVTSKIRAYNRISIYIAFFAIFAVVLAADRLWVRQEPGRRAVVAAAFGALLVLGLLDQTGAQAVPAYEKVAFDYGNDGEFIEQVEAIVPPGAMIFQLPAIAFPEHPSVHRMHDYDHARGYLRSRHLRWSYGAVRGRDGAVWQRWVAEQPPAALVDTLAAAGFSGLYVNREGYADGAAGLVAEVGRVLGQTPVVSGHGRLVFFDLTAHRAELRAALTPEAWRVRQDAALHPLLIDWQNGCSDLEADQTGTFRWCAADGLWRVINGDRGPKRVTIEMTFTAAHPGELSIEGPLLSRRLSIDHVARTVSTTVSIPPGVHELVFRCTAPRLMASADRRELVFRVGNFWIGGPRTGPPNPP